MKGSQRKEQVLLWVKLYSPKWYVEVLTPNNCVCDLN